MIGTLPAMLLIMSKSFEDVVDDLEQITHNDERIKRAQHALFVQHVISRKVYRELMLSKFYGHVKYLVARYPDETIVITDLDTNISYTNEH